MIASIALAVHALAAVVWVGGMFFAYMALRPAIGPLPPSERLALWRRTFGKFFVWVWLAIAALLATGYWIVFFVLGGFASAGLHVHIMQGIGIVMMLLFAHLWFAPWKRLQGALDANDLPLAAEKLNQIRLIVVTNLTLGLIVVAVAVSGRFWA